MEICLEISKELFDFFDRCELEDVAFMNEIKRHADKTELTPYLLNVLANQSMEPLFDLTAKKQETKELRMAIMMLPDTQRRRLLMYYWGNMTYKEIAAIEGCSFQAVEHSISKGHAQLKNILKNLSRGG